MSNAARKLKRLKQVKVPRCCGMKMKWKESMGCYICAICGKTRKGVK